jgi:hypothetical protein
MGIGGAFLIPTATDDLLGTKKLGVGPPGAQTDEDGLWNPCQSDLVSGWFCCDAILLDGLRLFLLGSGWTRRSKQHF